MKIKLVFHVLPSLKRGGFERQASIIYKETLNSSIKTQFILFSNKSKENSYIKEYGIYNKDIFNVDCKNKLKMLYSIYQLISKQKPDFILAWEFTGAIIIFFFNLFIRNFIFINATIQHGIKPENLNQKYRMLLAKVSKNIIANSKAGIEANGIKNGKILYNGIENHFFDKLEDEDKFKLKKSLNINNDEVVLVSIANFTPIKDHYTILKTLNTLNKKNICFKQIFIGDGPLAEKVKKYAKDMNLDSKIIFLGVVDNVKKYLSISDIMIHSSKGEGISNAILEGMAQGLPIVASDVGGTKEIVTMNNGYLFPYRSDHYLTKYVKKLILNPHERLTKGKESFRIAINKFSAKNMVKSYINILYEFEGEEN